MRDEHLREWNLFKVEQVYRVKLDSKQQNHDKVMNVLLSEAEESTKIVGQLKNQLADAENKIQE